MSSPSSSALDRLKPAVPVFVATTVMLTFISFWRASAIVLSDLASSAYYVGGDTENVIGKSAPWFVLGVMLFSYAVRAVYIESSSMFVRGGVYRVVKEAMGSTLAKLSVSALLFDYVLTGPISAVSAGQYLAGFVGEIAKYLGHPVAFNENYFAAGCGVLVVLYFWWKNRQGIHETSGKAMFIMRVTTVMVIILIVWCLITIFKIHAHLPAFPSIQNMKWDHESLGWLPRHWATSVTFIALLVGFGHSVLAMSGEETLAQVNREIEHPKLKNLERAGLVIFIYSLLFTSLVSFFAVMIIPDHARSQFFPNLIGGLSMYVVGPVLPKLVFHFFVVLVGALILSGAVNTAIVGANGVLNRVSEDGVLTSWFQRPHRRYGTTYRLINLIVVLQIITIVVSRGNVYFLAALYAFGVIWSFGFKALAVLVLRYTEPENREWKVPGNLPLSGGKEVPLGLMVITIVLFLTAITNLLTKPAATIAGVSFSLAFFVIFTVSERHTAKERHGRKENIEQFRVSGEPELSSAALRVRPGNVLVTVRDPHNLYYLRNALARTDTTKQDVVVMTARLYQGPAFSGNRYYEAKDVFDDYEQELFTKVVATAEKEGKPVSLLVVPGKNVFQSIVVTAAHLDSAKVITGLSNKLTADEQGKYTGDAWEQLPEPRPRLTLEVIAPDGAIHSYPLGPHEPRLRAEDIDLLHKIWLDITHDPHFAALHHYDVLALALDELQRELVSGRRPELLELLQRELLARHSQPDPGSKPN
ncbi:MAG: APC family permease [Terriglobales bacterium]